MYIPIFSITHTTAIQLSNTLNFPGHLQVKQPLEAQFKLSSVPYLHTSTPSSPLLLPLMLFLFMSPAFLISATVYLSRASFKPQSRVGHFLLSCFSILLILIFSQHCLFYQLCCPICSCNHPVSSVLSLPGYIQATQHYQAHFITLTSFTDHYSLTSSATHSRRSGPVSALHESPTSTPRSDHPTCLSPTCSSFLIGQCLNVYQILEETWGM